MNGEKLYGLSENELKISVARLAHFSPSLTDDDGNQVLDYLVLDALVSIGPLFESSASDVKSAIKKNVLLEFEESEIVESAKRLAQRNQIEFTPLAKWNTVVKLKIRPHVEHEISVKRTESQTLEKSVLGKWRNHLLEKYNSDGSIKDNMERIVGALQGFISKMFIKHGLDSVSILYPDSGKVQKWLDAVDKSLTESLPKINDFIDSLLTIEIAEFIKNEDPDRKAYLTNLFNSSYYWHLIQVDEKCSNVLKSVTREQKLVLDNNILYNLVGIHGDILLESSHRLLKFAKELGYELLVTTKTIDEFQNSLKWQMREYKSKLPVAASLASIATDRLGSDNFVTVYWKQLATRRISIEEFVLETSHIENILEGLEIEVTHKFQKDIEGSDELADEITLLKQAVGDHFNEHIIEHDAFHRIFISKLRKGNKYNFKDARAWFLTQDTKLPHYSRYARRGETYLPFCLTTNQWIQLNRPFLSRTKNSEEYEASMYNLIAQPFLRNILPRHPLQEAYSKVFGRLSRFENISPQLASEMTADTHFMFSIAGFEQSEKSQEEIDQKVDNKITEANKTLRQDIEKLNLEGKASLNRIRKLEERLDSIGREAMESKKEIELREKQQKESELNHEGAVVNLQATIAGHIGENTKLRESLDILLYEKIDNLVSVGLRKWKRNGLIAIICVGILILIGILELLPSWDLNYPAKFLSWIDGLQSESKKDLLKTINVSVLGGPLVTLAIYAYNRLSSDKIKSKKEELMKHHKDLILKPLKN